MRQEVNIINPMSMSSMGGMRHPWASMGRFWHKLVAAWLTLHEEDLYEAWNNAVQMKQLPKIRPLS